MKVLYQLKSNLSDSSPKTPLHQFRRCRAPELGFKPSNSLSGGLGPLEIAGKQNLRLPRECHNIQGFFRVKYYDQPLTPNLPTYQSMATTCSTSTGKAKKKLSHPKMPCSIHPGTLSSISNRSIEHTRSALRWTRLKQGLYLRVCRGMKSFVGIREK